MKTDFVSRSVAYGLYHDEFADLDTKTERKLIRLMAKISEASYRRGFQHGTLPGRTVDAERFRYGMSLERCPSTDGGSAMDLEFRLFAEYGVLRDLGFEETGRTPFPPFLDDTSKTKREDNQR